MSPDPYKASAGPQDPKSWNRYSYVLADPINYNDPLGLDTATVSGSCEYQQFWKTSFDGPGEIVTIQVCTVTIQAGGDDNNAAPDRQRPGYNLSNNFWRKNLEYRLTKSTQLAMLALTDPQCLKHFNTAGKLNPDDLLAKLLAGNSDYGSIQFDDGMEEEPGHITDATVQGGPYPPGAAIDGWVLISLNAAFGHVWQGGDYVNAAATLIHELAHAFNKIWGDGPSDIPNDHANTDQSVINQKTILSDCFGVKTP